MSMYRFYNWLLANYMLFKKEWLYPRRCKGILNMRIVYIFLISFVMFYLGYIGIFYYGMHNEGWIWPLRQGIIYGLMTSLIIIIIIYDWKYNHEENR